MLKLLCVCLVAFVAAEEALKVSEESSCFHRSDGKYQDLALSGVDHISGACHKKWTIVRYASVDQLKPLFKSWSTHQTGISGHQNFFGPHVDQIAFAKNKHSSSGGNPEQSSFAGWLKTEVASKYEFAVSDDCTTVASGSGKSYYATGNYMHNSRRGGACQYYNRNCDMKADGQCQSCRDNYSFHINQPSRQPGGTCTHNVGGSWDTYPMHHHNCHHWWNRFPAIPTRRQDSSITSGSDKEMFCIAFREVEAPKDFYNTPAPTPNTAAPSLEATLEFKGSTGTCEIGKSGDGSLFSSCDLSVKAHDKTYNIANELRTAAIQTSMPGGDISASGSGWGNGVGEYSTKMFTRAGPAHNTNPPTHGTAKFQLFEINNNYHWGGVHMDLEVWENYYSPGYKKYEYHNAGGDYHIGGSLKQVDSTQQGGGCYLEREHVGQIGKSSGATLNLARITLHVPIYKTCFVKVKQSVSSMPWYSDPHKKISSNARYTKFMQKFAKSTGGASQSTHSIGDGAKQTCDTDC